MKNAIEQEIDAGAHLLSMTPVNEIVRLGYALGIDSSFKVLDLCCGYGEMLRIFSENFGCTGDGVDLSKEFIAEGKNRIASTDLSTKIRLYVDDARNWTTTGFDIACLVGEQDVFDGFENTMNMLFSKVHENGRVLIGTPFYLQPDVPKELIEFEGKLQTEIEIFDIVKRNQCIITHIARDTRSEWDRYISWCTRRNLANYRNETDPAKKMEKLDWMHKWHEMYLQYRMEYEGWAIYAIERI